MIYESSPAQHLSVLANILLSKIRTGHRCFYLNSPAMVAGIRSYLAAGGLEIGKAVQNGSLVLSSDQNHLVGGRFDIGNMLRMLRQAVEDALAAGFRGLWATGDMTWEFGPERDFEKLLEYEIGLEKLFAELPALSGICQYHRQTLPDSALVEALHIHPGVHVSETLSRINPFYVPPDLLARNPALFAGSRLDSMLQQLRGTA